jgi:hypothetical protein
MPRLNPGGLSSPPGSCGAPPTDPRRRRSREISANRVAEIPNPRSGAVDHDVDGVEVQEVGEHEGDADSVARYVLEGTLPNGLAFDRAGNFVIANFGTDVEAAFIAGTMTPEVLGGGLGTLAPMMASVTFGGPDLRTVYLGSLMGHTLPSFRSPVPGLPMAHWHAHA